MKINHRHYILTIIAITCFFTSIFGYIYVYDKVAKQVENYEKAVHMVTKQDSMIKYGEKLYNIYSSTKENREKILSYVVRDDKIINFIETVEMVGENTETNFELSSIARGDEIISAKISVDGSWSNILRVIGLIENLPYNISIKNFNISTSRGLDMPSTLKVKEKKPSSVNLWKLTMDIEALTSK